MSIQNFCCDSVDFHRYFRSFSAVVCVVCLLCDIEIMSTVTPEDVNKLPKPTDGELSNVLFFLFDCLFFLIYSVMITE